MKYCKKCVMPSTRPGIQFDDEGICSACQSYERRKGINWDKRYEELEKLCDKYRGINGSSYDCAIAVSGGKDSHYQVYFMKEVMKMNPILFNVDDNFEMTEAGKHNIKNISETFGCNIVSLKPDIKAQKKIMRYMFEKYGQPTWFFDRLIYTFPLHMALKFNTMLLVYGENISYEYGGPGSKETYSARDQLKNGVASDIYLSELTQIDGITEQTLDMTKPPAMEEMEKLDPMYVSYFIQWNSYANYKFAKSRGFHDLTHEWDRTHTIENYDQIESPAYLIHPWLKYPKFGHASATDYASRLIRYGRLTREEAIQLVKKHDHALDPKSVDHFIKFLGYSEYEFWNIIDKLYNKDIFHKNNVNEWALKNPIWNESSLPR